MPSPRPLSSDTVATYSRVELAQTLGIGWADRLHTRHGISVARARYQFNVSHQDSYVQEPGSLAIKIMLSGELHLQSPQRQVPAHYRGQGVMLRHTSDRHELRRDMHGQVSGVSIDVPAHMLASVLDEQGIKLDGRHEDGLLLAQDHRGHLMSLNTATQLLETPLHSAVGRLHAEGAALQILATLLDSEIWNTPQRRPGRHRLAVDRAREILHDEFADSHSISSLARQVGLNECYLKSAFKAITGQTIAQYLRTVRMNHARTLIESGQCSVLQSCEFVGYSNPGQFAAAFRRIHGITPSSLKTRY